MAVLERQVCILTEVDDRDIIVIGASAGGYEAIERVVCCLPVTYPTAIFVAIHVGKASRLENALNGALAQSEEMTALLESSISSESSESLSAIHKELSALSEEQDVIRRLTGRRRDPTTIEE